MELKVKLLKLLVGLVKPAAPKTRESPVVTGPVPAE